MTAGTFDTNRDPYTATRVSAEQVSELSGLADGSGATLQFYSDATSRKTLGDFGVEGTLIETRYAASTSAAMAANQAYAMISTAGNSRREQVEAGILYARFSLRARTLGLVMQPLSQVLQEYSSMSMPCAAIHEQFAPKGETIQMLVRVGTATTDYPPNQSNFRQSEPRRSGHAIAS